MAACGTGSLIFVDAILHVSSSRLNSKVDRNILSAHIQRNASNLMCIIMQQDNDPKTHCHLKIKPGEAVSLLKSVSSFYKQGT